MALAVDTKHLLDEWIPQRVWLYNHNLHLVDGNHRRRLHLHRVCVQATVIHDAATRAQLTRYPHPRQNAPLDWQPEPNQDEADTMFHNLEELATTSTSTKLGALSTSPPTGLISKAGSTTLIASVEFPSSAKCSFPRYSSRTITEHCSNGASSRRCCLHGLLVDCGYGYSDIMKVVPSFPVGGISLLVPRIVATNVRERYHSVIWHVQLDFLEISGRSSYIIPTGIGRRSPQTLKIFQCQEVLRCQDECFHERRQGGELNKKFKGVRYRHDRHRWVAEMKPPKSKNKVFFGQFQSETEAARVVDVALHHYGKPLNFADTPQILSKERSSAGLGDEAKLKLVKEQAKWVASMTSTLPSSPGLSRGVTCTSPSHPRSEILEPCSAATLGFRSFSEISSSLGSGGTTDEADDGVSQPHHLLDLMAGYAGKEALKVNLDTAHQACVMDEFGGNLSVENAIADPCDVGISLEYFVNFSAVWQPKWRARASWILFARIPSLSYPKPVA